MPREGRLSFNTVAERAKEALGLDTDAALAAALGMQSKAYSARKRADSIPVEELVSLALARRIDLNWLFAPGPYVEERRGQYETRPPPDSAGTMRRIREATEAIVRAEREAGLSLPRPWPNLLQEMIVIYGMDPAGVPRVLEMLKQEEGKQ